MMLLKEFERNPHSPEAEISRNVIDQTMALCSPDGGITGSDGWNITPRPLTEGGAEAWDLIRRLRARVWAKAGLDPDIILTRDEVKAIVAEKMESFKSSGTLDLRTPPLLWPPAQRASQSQLEVPSLDSGHPGSTRTGFGPSSRSDHLNLFATVQEQELTTGLGGAGPTPNFNWEEWDSIFNAGIGET